MKVMNGRAVLCGDRDFGFVVVIDGEDLLLFAPDGVSPVEASFFGGTEAQDPGDNGETASGKCTRNLDGTENHIPGFSLPHDPREKDTGGSPIPQLPYGIAIRAYNVENGREAEAELIDDGPAWGTEHAIDCTRMTFADELGGAYDAGLVRVHVRILGGAQHLPEEIAAEARAMMGVWQQSQHDSALAWMGGP